MSHSEGQTLPCGYYCLNQSINFLDTFTPLLIRGENFTTKDVENSDYIEANYCRDTRISIEDMGDNSLKWTVLISMNVQ